MINRRSLLLATAFCLVAVGGVASAYVHSTIAKYRNGAPCGEAHGMLAVLEAVHLILPGNCQLAINGTCKDRSRCQIPNPVNPALMLDGICTTVPINSCACVPLTPGVLPPSIAKTFGAGSISLGGTTSLGFTITNPNGGTTLTGVDFTDDLPAGLVVATPNGLIGSCGGGTITATAGSGTVSLGGASLAASASCTFSVNVTGTTAGPKSNSTQVVSTEGGGGNTTTANLTVVGPPTISKTFGAVNIPLNGSTSLSFTINNPNPSTTLNSIGFTDTLPAGLVVSTPNGLTGSCGGGAITATAGSDSISLSNATLGQGASCTFSVTTKATSAGTMNNTTSAVTSTEGGSGGTASASVTVCSTPSITCPGAITKFADSGQLSASINPGTPVTNGGCSPLTVTGVRSDGKALNAPYPTGVTLITWTAKDASNTVATCSQSISVTAPSGVHRKP